MSIKHLLDIHNVQKMYKRHSCFTIHSKNEASHKTSQDIHNVQKMYKRRLKNILASLFTVNKRHPIRHLLDIHNVQKIYKRRLKDVLVSIFTVKTRHPKRQFMTFITYKRCTNDVLSMFQKMSPGMY